MKDRIPVVRSRRRKNSLRLPEFDYSRPEAYSLTICSAGRKQVFGNPKIAEEVLCLLRKCIVEFEFDLLAYCLMPDHLHLLVCPNDSGRSVSEFVRHFKSLTGFSFKSQTKARLWQRGFYDHVVRKTEDLQTVANYILHNPVRKGLTESPQAYSYAWMRDG